MRSTFLALLSIRNVPTELWGFFIQRPRLLSVSSDAFLSSQLGLQPLVGRISTSLTWDLLRVGLGFLGLSAARGACIQAGYV